MWQFFFHIWWFPYFFLITSDSFILTLCSSNVTCDNSFLTFGGSLTFFSHLTVPFYIVQFQHHMWQFFFTFGGSLTFFFSHLTVSFSHCVVPTSHMTALLSHWVVLYFFLIFDGSILILCSSNITCDSSFLTFGGSLTSFFTFNGSIFTLCNFNITCDSFFSSHWRFYYFFTHIWQFHPYIVWFQHHIW